MIVIPGSYISGRFVPDTPIPANAVAVVYSTTTATVYQPGDSLPAVTPGAPDLPATRTYDVVVVGATAAGVMAAIAAAKESSRVLLIESTSWLGGMVTGGLSATDVLVGSGRSAVVSAANEFYALCAEEMGQTQQKYWRTQYNAPPSIAQYVMRRMLAKYNIDLRMDSPLEAVEKSGLKIVAATFTKEGRIASSVWIDATYEGDLMAAAGCSFSVGRDANALYSESLAGVIYSVTKQVPDGIDPYVTPGSAGSGLLPNIFPGAAPTAAAASPYVMAFNYRLTVTRANNRVAFPEPDSYDASQYEVLGRTAQVTGGTFPLPMFLETLGGVVAGASTSTTKYDANNSGMFSTDYVHPDCTTYITAKEPWRAACRERIKQYTLGLIKFTKTDTRIPSGVRSDMASIGLCPDEFQAYGGFTPQLYVREGRRMVGDFVLKQGDINSQNSLSADAVAFAYYNMDSHPCARYNISGNVKMEGIIDSGNTAYYGAWIPMRVAFPKVTECTNLLVTCALSLSRVAYTGLRMEPIFMAMGHACGATAALAASMSLAVQSVPTARILDRVDLRGTQNIGSGALLDTSGVYAQGAVTTSGTWATASGSGGIGTSVRTSVATGATITFAPNIKAPRAYRVLLKWSDSDSNSSAVPVTVNHAGGTTSFVINQTLDGHGGDWYDLGVFAFTAGSPSANTLVIGTDGLGGRTLISAVKWIPA